MPSKIHIRRAELGDSRSIAQLSGQLGYDSSEGEIRARLSKMIDTKDNCIYVALDQDRIVGWVHALYALRVESDPFVEIAGLVVDEHDRKEGIGKLLVERIIQWAEGRKGTMIRVRTNTIRTESHRFYEKLGFSLKKEQKIYDKIIL